MGDAYTGRRPRGGGVARAADRLSLAAAPTFAGMAMLTSMSGGPADMLCSAASAGTPLHGMAIMYLLMSAFHAAPWLKLIGRARSGGAGFPE